MCVEALHLIGVWTTCGEVGASHFGDAGENWRRGGIIDEVEGHPTCAGIEARAMAEARHLHEIGIRHVGQQAATPLRGSRRVILSGEDQGWNVAANRFVRYRGRWRDIPRGTHLGRRRASVHPA